MKFMTEDGKRDAIKIGLRQDGDDVNITINGLVKLWFEGESSTLIYSTSSLEEYGISLEDTDN